MFLFTLSRQEAELTPAWSKGHPRDQGGPRQQKSWELEVHRGGGGALSASEVRQDMACPEQRGIRQEKARPGRTVSVMYYWV